MMGMHGAGEIISKLVRHALEHQLKDQIVSEHELYEILSEYLENGEFSSTYARRELGPDGGAEHTRGRDIKSLWQLLPKSPKSIGFLLVTHLPECAGLGNEIPHEVLNSMDDKQLVLLLYRPDISLSTLRKKIFFDPNESRGDLRIAAVSHNFDIEYSEFTKILARRDSDRLKNLGDLVYVSTLKPCMAEAICDCLEEEHNLEGDAESHKRYYIRQLALKNLERSLGRIKSPCDWRIAELKVYRLARRAAPWRRDREGYLPTELEYLRELIVEGNPWATFMQFFTRLERFLNNQWSSFHNFELRSNYAKLLSLLPRIEEVEGTEVTEATAPAEKGQIEDLAGQIKENCSGILSACTSGAQTLERVLKQTASEQSRTLDEKASEEKAAIIGAFKGLGTQLASLRHELGILRLLLLLAFGVILFLLIR